MEDDGDLTQVTMSQRMADKPSTSLRPNHNYSRTPGPNGKVRQFSSLILQPCVSRILTVECNEARGAA